MTCSRMVLAVCVGALLAACSRPEPDDGAAAAQARPEHAQLPQDVADADAPTAQPGPDDAAEAGEAAVGPGEPGFDIASVPVSDAALGDFPYFSLPEGYRHPNRPIPVRDFDRVAFWTGDRLEWVDGKVHQSLIHAERGKAFSRLEVVRNIDHQIAEAGGAKVADSRVPREIRQEWDDGQQRSPGRGGIANHPAATWLVRRADRDIWVHMVASNTSGAWTIVESAPFEPTASLLPSSELREALDRDGRVALQVHFATDRAEILPESQPQIEQILELLREDPALSLSVNGHTDATGGADHNQRLSEARAQAVVAALTGAGIDAARLDAAGFGQSAPVAGNDTEQGRALNRRVELVRR